MSVNKVILVGRLGRDPEVKFFDDGNCVCNLSIATSEKWKDRDGQMQERTEWHRVVVKGKAAKHCGDYLAKGREVYLEGKNQTRKYTKDGADRYTTEVIVYQVQFLGSKGDQQERKPEPKKEAHDYGPPPMEDEGLPF